MRSDAGAYRRSERSISRKPVTLPMLTSSLSPRRREAIPSTNVFSRAGRGASVKSKIAFAARDPRAHARTRFQIEPPFVRQPRIGQQRDVGDAQRLADEIGLV